MRRNTHLLLGALAFTAYTYPVYLLLRIPSDLILMGLCTALLGSVMPDVFEPARTRYHRGLGHSRRALRGAIELFGVTAILGLFQSLNPSLSPAYIVSGFFLGYAVHLLADSLTPAGLPA